MYTDKSAQKKQIVRANINGEKNSKRLRLQGVTNTATVKIFKF